jgi:hypothetical protein
VTWLDEQDRVECERCVEAAAYVLGALDEPEVEPYREHTTGCAVCRAEVAQLQAVADSLPLAVTHLSAPGGLRARIMAVVHAEAELLRAAGHEADRPIPARTRRWLRPLPALVAGTAAMAAGVLVGALAINNGSGSQSTRVVQALVVAPGHSATASLHQSGAHVELEVVGLPAPPPGRIYEIWLERGTQAPEPTDALFSVTNAGDGSVGVPSNLRGVSKVLVTDEPLGGSLKPTRNPVIVARV